MNNEQNRVKIFSLILFLSSVVMIFQDYQYIPINEKDIYIYGRIIVSSIFLGIFIQSFYYISNNIIKLLLINSLIYTIHGLYFRQGYFLAFIEMSMLISVLFQINKIFFLSIFTPFSITCLFITKYYHSESYLTYTLENLKNDQLFGIFVCSICAYLLYWLITQKEQIRRKMELKNIDMGKYTSNLIHDLKGFMSGPLFYLDVLERTNLDKNQQKYIEKLKLELDLIKDFIQETNQMSVLQQKENESFYVSEIVETIKKLNKVDFVNIQFKMEGDIKILTNKNYFLRSLFNIVKNSIESLKEKNVSNPQIKLIVKNNYLYCQDNGEGFPENILKNIKNKTYYQSSKKHGSGFGIAIIQEFLSELKIKPYFYNKNGAVIKLDLSKVINSPS